MKAKLCFKLTIIFLIMLIGISISTIINASSEDIMVDKYKIINKDGENYIIGIYQTTRALEVKGNVQELIEGIYGKDGKELSDASLVHTGSYIEFDGVKYKMIVCGDINGDGKVSLTDLVKLKNRIIGKENLIEEYEIAADINLDEKVSVTDILYLKKLLVRIISERDIYGETGSTGLLEYSVNILKEEVTIEDTAETIAETISIPNKIDGKKVTKIKKFTANNTIKKIIISEYIESIEDSAFSELTALENIEVNEKNQHYSSYEGLLLNKKKDTLIVYPRGRTEKEFILPSTITKIDKGAFYKVINLEKLYIGDQVIEIHEKTFEGFTGTIYGNENSKIIDFAKKHDIKYVIIKELVITVRQGDVKTRKEVLEIKAMGTSKVVEWAVTKGGATPINWTQIKVPSNILEVTYEVTLNGSYTIWVKDNLQNVSKKVITIETIDLISAKVESIKIISPASGKYKPGEKVVIRVKFTEVIKGSEVPILALKIGDKAAIGTMESTIPDGTTDYIDYIYTSVKEEGIVTIGSLTGGNIVDLAENYVGISGFANKGNEIEIYIPRLEVHFIHLPPLGQPWPAGSSILVKCEGKTMLIDGGEERHAPYVYSYLKSKGVTHLDYVALTHEDTDHYKGLKAMMSNYVDITVGRFITAPNLRYSAIYGLDRKIAERGATLGRIKPGNTFRLGEATVECLGPYTIWSKGYDNQNSLILKFTLGNTSFISMGDADYPEVANELIAKHGDKLKADLLEIAHHGSDKILGSLLLEKVRPRYGAACTNAEIGDLAAFPQWTHAVKDLGIELYTTRSRFLLFKLDGDNVTVETKNI